MPLTDSSVDSTQLGKNQWTEDQSMEISQSEKQRAKRLRSIYRASRTCRKIIKWSNTCVTEIQTFLETGNGAEDNIPGNNGWEYSKTKENPKLHKHEAERTQCRINTLLYPQIHNHGCGFGDKEVCYVQTAE